MKTTANLIPGQQIWSIATGRISLLRKDSRMAAKFVAEQEGFIGATPTNEHTIWFFDSQNNAKIARNRIEAQGGKCGRNICSFTVDENGVPVFDEGQMDGR